MLYYIIPCYSEVGTIISCVCLYAYVYVHVYVYVCVHAFVYNVYMYIR